jgi:hypothetical protein
MTEAKSSPQGAGITRSRSAASASRSVQERSEREAGARRALFVASVAGLAAALSVVAVSGGPPHVAEEVQTASGGETPAARRIVAEIPIPAADGQGIETIVRIVAVGPDTAAPDIRTGATP